MYISARARSSGADQEAHIAATISAAWVSSALGHMPEFVIAEELRRGKLVALTGKHLKGGVSEIVAARRHDRPHGPVAQRLWRYIEEQAASLRRQTKRPARRR